MKYIFCHLKCYSLQSLNAAFVDIPYLTLNPTSFPNTVQQQWLSWLFFQPGIIGGVVFHFIYSRIWGIVLAHPTAHRSVHMRHC